MRGSGVSRGCIAALAVMAALTLAPAPGAAQEELAKTWNDCQDFVLPAEAVITACTAYIDSGQEMGRALAFGSRGLKQTDTNLALADFDEAIRLDPGLVFALVSRGKILVARGDTPAHHLADQGAHLLVALAA